MGKKDGNTDIQVVGQWANFSGLVGQALWSAIKPAVAKGEFDFLAYNKIETVRSILRRGFLPQTTKTLISNLNVGKVSKQELVQLSAWDLKNLYPFFYQAAFGLFLDFPDELMPEGTEEFSWPFCIPGIISNEVAFQNGKLNIPRWKYMDKPLDAVMDLSRGRDAWLHSYIGLAHPNWEADEDLKNLSGNDIENKKINVMMFRERWILGAFLYWLTGEHLDQKTITLTGSRYLDGRVPVVFFGRSDGRVCVNWSSPGRAGGSLRSRQVVSA